MRRLKQSPLLTLCTLFTLGALTLPSFYFQTQTAIAAVTTIPHRAKTRTLSTNQKNFIKKLLPEIKQVNSSISNDRKQLLSLKQQINSDARLPEKNRAWLLQLAKRYNLKPAATFNKNIIWHKLLNRVDTIPIPLALAQAANESAWGRSRFATEGNNYFGQWCSRPGCGLVPRKRPAGKRYEVQRFESATTSIASYIHNLNTHRAYAALRKIRAEKRIAGLPITGLQLAEGLKSYSSRKEAYVHSIQNIIIHYNLAALTQKTLG